MSIIVKKYHDIKSAINFLEQLALNQDTVVFRGHTTLEHRLKTTWHRHRKIYIGTNMADVTATLNQFDVGMAKLGFNKNEIKSHLDSLEHARHYGIPTPCLDFTYSPYVALFFAFNGIKPNRERGKITYSVLYALNINKLAWSYASKQYSPQEDQDKHFLAYNSFLNPDEKLFDDGFPENELHFIPYPGKDSIRMQRQFGALLYDSILYDYLNVNNFEEYISEIDEIKNADGDSEPTLYKILINHKCASSVFERLELMNMTGANLYNSAEGVAMDIKNTHYYNPKFSYLRGITRTIN